MFKSAKKLVILLIFVVLATASGPRGLEAREVQLLMALDVSGSMKVTDPQRLLPKSAHIMVELLDEKDHLGLLTFEDVTLTRLALGPLNPAQRRKGFQELTRLQPRGLYTDLHQVLAAGLKSLGPPGQAKQALLLISDGQMDIDPRKGNSKAFVERVHQEIIPAYKKAGIPIYTVAFTTASDQALLKTLAEETGGRFLLIPAANDLHQAFTRFYEDLKGPQVAPLVGNHFTIDPQVQEAILVVSRSQQGKAVVLETPQGRKLDPASKAVRWFTAPNFDMVTIPKPEAGKWTVSGHKEGEGKVILMTDLKLEWPHLSADLGGDEALVTGALLINKGQPVIAPEVLTQTVFTAELQPEGGKPVQLPLEAPSAEQKELWPPGTRVAKFPTFSAPGIWQLRIRALGKTFQRERNISLKVSQPWYKVQQVSGDGPAQVEFLPNPDRKAGQLAGWVSISAPAGGVAGKFVNPSPGSSFRFVLPPDLTGSYRVNLELSGVTTSGRPLSIQPLPLRLNLTPRSGAAVKGSKGTEAAAAEGPKSPAVTSAMGPQRTEAAVAKEPKTKAEASAPGPPGPAVAVPMGPKSMAADSAVGPKSAAAASSPPAPRVELRSRKWLWLGVMGLVIAVGILATAVYVFRPQALLFLIRKSSEETISEDMPLEKRNLLLMAQVESLQKEKGKLSADLGEMRRAMEKLKAAKEDLEARLGEPSAEYQEKSKIINELESRLEEAEKEAKSVQEEYMALYARNQKEKQELKKG
jgi:hypothetical protein